MMKSGYTTGACAAAAAKAALLVMMGHDPPRKVTITLPDGDKLEIPVASAEPTIDGAKATIIKDAGDDPDITNNAAIMVSLSDTEGNAIGFIAGEGVGTVTKSGLSVPPGEPAINPVPRRMITEVIRSLTDRGILVTISIPGGASLAAKTFNPRLGITGGLSILGTTGRVRPFSCSAIRESIRCAIDVAMAGGIKKPVLVPGHIGARSAITLFAVKEEEIIEVGNEWGFVVDEVNRRTFGHILVVGHPGKLAKLAQGSWDTHSSRSKSAMPYVARLSTELTGCQPPKTPTVEGIFGNLPEIERRNLGNLLAYNIKKAFAEKIGTETSLSVVLVDMKGNLLGAEGEMTPWQ